MNSRGPVGGRVQVSKAASSSAESQLPGEELLVEMFDHSLIVTTHRVQYVWNAGGASRYVSITHDSISSCGLTTNSQPVLWILAVATALVGIFTGATMKEWPIGMAFVGLAAVLVLAFFLSRTATLLVCSNGGERISLPTSGSQREQLLGLLNVIDGAKIAAMERLALLGAGDSRSSSHRPSLPAR